MTLEKISEKVIRPEDPSYFMIREFSFGKTAINVLAEFMRTPFFCWKEEYRNEVHATINSEEKVVNWNFHGLYAIEKLKPEHFEKVSGSDFISQFKEFIKKEITFDSELPLIETELTNLIDLTSDFYIIKELPSDFCHEWTVFEFFISGFKINKNSGKLTAIEFGLD